MKVRFAGWRPADGILDSWPIVERALQLKDEKLTKMMADAGWIVPLDVTIDHDDPASIKRAKLMGIEVGESS